MAPLFVVDNNRKQTQKQSNNNKKKKQTPQKRKCHTRIIVGATASCLIFLVFRHVVVVTTNANALYPLLAWEERVKSRSSSEDLVRTREISQTLTTSDELLLVPSFPSWNKKNHVFFNVSNQNTWNQGEISQQQQQQQQNDQSPSTPISSRTMASYLPNDEKQHHPQPSSSRPLLAPYFSILGFSKCGTSFLKRWLAGELALSDGKVISKVATNDDENNNNNNNIQTSTILSFTRKARFCVHPVEYHPWDGTTGRTNATQQVVERMTTMLGTASSQSLALPLSSASDPSFVLLSDCSRRSSIMVSMEKNNETVADMLGHERSLSQPSQIIVTGERQVDTGDPHYCCGYKGPTQLRRPHELAMFRDYWPQTKLIVGIRHPVWWFQSIYNYRMQTEPDHIAHQIPPLNVLANLIITANSGTNNSGTNNTVIHDLPNGGCLREICLQRAFMHSHLALLGKTPLHISKLAFEVSSPLLQGLSTAPKMPQFRQVLSPKVPNLLFLYDVTQVDGVRNPSIAQALRVDLSNFLQLNELERGAQPQSTRTSDMGNHQSTSYPILLQPLDLQTTENHGHGRQSAANLSSSSSASLQPPTRTRVSICTPELAPLRQTLVAIGKEASEWITNHFMHLSDVTISSPEFFRQALEEWGHDPCPSTTAAATATSNPQI